MRVLELDGGAAIARRELGHGLAILAVQQEQLPEPLAGLLFGVLEVHAGLERPRAHLQEAELADVLLAQRAVAERDRLAARLDGEVAAALLLHGAPVERGGRDGG